MLHAYSSVGCNEPTSLQQYSVAALDFLTHNVRFGLGLVSLGLGLRSGIGLANPNPNPNPIPNQVGPEAEAARVASRAGGWAGRKATAG